MKKLMNVVLGVAATALTLSSCSMTYVTATNNAVGDKVGNSKVGLFDFANKDYSYLKAAKAGGVDKIGVVEQTSTYYLFFYKTNITVTGN